MEVDRSSSKTTPLDQLAFSKALQPLPGAAIEILTKIQSLDVRGFSEAEVRFSIIDPIVRLLGYDKGDKFSVDLEKRVDFLNKKRFPDYRVTLWQENFWLIEAKRPDPSDHFQYQTLAQAVEYATHPDINAALVVLCDGYKFEVFDREVSLTKPALNVRLESIVRDFDQLRGLLEPWQIWFFEKRRIARLIDRVFDREFNLDRLAEFKDFVSRRLDSKRAVVLKNYQSIPKGGDTKEQVLQMQNASTEDLINIHMFLEHPIPIMNAIRRTLVARSSPGSFAILYKMFPDTPRDANDVYHPHTLAYLMALEQQRQTVEWLPAWLAPAQQSNPPLEIATKTLIRHCLSCFEADEARKAVILAAATFGRLFRLMSLASEGTWRVGQTLHLLQRYRDDELAWSQILSSKERQVLGMINGHTLIATNSFVRECQPEPGGFESERSEFKTEVAKLRLRELWTLERALLGSIQDYGRLNKERNLGEVFPPDARQLTYDFLGHMSLCLLQRDPKWSAYVLMNHREDVEKLAAFGSFAARDMLGLKPEQKIDDLPDEQIAKRFFFGDVSTLRDLRSAYRGKVK